MSESSRQKSRQKIRYILMAYTGTVAVCGLSFAVYLERFFRTGVIPGQAALLFYYFALGTFFLLAVALVRLVPGLRRRKNDILLFVLTICLCIAATGAILRFVVKRYASYMELNGLGYYATLYRPSYIEERDRRSASVQKTWLHLHGANTEVTETKNEFSFTRPTNSRGLVDRDIPVKKAPDEFRIFCLGDSFTEGVGAALEDTWPKALERDFAALHPEKKVTVLNAGASGSDPFFEYVLLKYLLLPYSPDVVVAAVNSSDVNDVICRGGMERFLPQGGLRYRKAPSWEWLYAVSFLTRHIVHDVLDYDWRLLPKDRIPELEAEAMDRIYDSLELFQTLADEEGFVFVAVIHPGHFEVVQNKLVLDPLAEKLAKQDKIRFANLLGYYQAKGVKKENIRDYYWVLDRHHNARGYALMAHGILDALLAMPDVCGELFSRDFCRARAEEPIPPESQEDPGTPSP